MNSGFAPDRRLQLSISIATMSLCDSRLPFDVLFHIVQIIDPNERRVFCALSRICKALSDPALARLWHTQDSIIPLLLLVPSDYRITKWTKGRSLTTIRKDALVTLRKEPCQLARMAIYVKRVKIFHGLFAPRSKASNETVQFMLEALPKLFGTKFTFPNLTELRLTRNEMSQSSDIFRSNPWNPGDPRRLFVLLAPSIRHFAFNASDDWSSRSCVVLMIVEALLRCRQLHTLSVLSTVPLRDTNSPPPIVIDLRTHFKTTGALEELTSLATQSISLEDVSITTQRSSYYMDLIASPFTVHIFGQFKSIRRLSLSLDTMNGTVDQLNSHDSTFPELHSLKLRLISPIAATWFLNSIASSKLKDVDFQLVNELSIESLHQFITSLDQFKSKLSHVREFGLRAYIRTPEIANWYEHYRDQKWEPRLIPVIATTSRLFPHIHALKLKLFEVVSYTRGFIESYDLSTIAGAFPDLQVLKIATGSFSHPVSLPTVVHFAREFPNLRELGLTLDCGESVAKDLLDDPMPGCLGLGIKDKDSGLRVLKVRHSQIAAGHEADVAMYLKKHLGSLCSVRRSQQSQWVRWDKVDQMLC